MAPDKQLDGYITLLFREKIITNVCLRRCNNKCIIILVMTGMRYICSLGQWSTSV